MSTLSMPTNAVPLILTAVSPHMPRGCALGGAVLRAALIAGCHEVMGQRDFLNRINVFPVADGDTGTNMAFTFAAILEGATAARGKSAVAVLKTAAMHAIDGARGNSGAIVAQFFYGLSEAVGGKNAQPIDSERTIPFDELAGAIASGALGARLALAEPREGTVLSVMRDFSSAMTALKPPRGALSKVQAFCAAFAGGIGAAKRALAKTPSQLAVLAEHGVVDAGGSGFVSFLEGVQKFILRGRSAAHQTQTAKYASVPLFPAHTHDSAAPSRYRYCTECLLENLDLAALRGSLANFALDSLVLAGGQDRAHLHAHTNDPAALFALAGTFGSVSQRKADDMHAQLRAKSNTARVAIVCDTAADLPAAEVERLFIHTVPVRVNFGEEEFIDRITLSTEQFYQRLRTDATPVRTSQPPSGEFRRLFDQLGSQHAEVLCLNISSKLSGTYQAACAAARHGSANTAVFDTLNAAAGEALLILDCAQGAQAGMDSAALQARAREMRARTHTFAMIHDASFAARGGRLPRWLLPITRVLRLSLLISDSHGRIVPRGVLIGKHNLPERFARWVAKRIARIARAEGLPNRQQGAPGRCEVKLIVGHCDALQDAQALQTAIQNRPEFTVAACHLVAAGTGVGAHAGPGSLVVGVQRCLVFPTSGL
jgi:uncharacterized protein